MAERSAKQLGLSKADLPNSIIEVIATLTKSGFEAFIVGGGVRDTLLGLNPKDFDAVTDAKPHEVKDLFGKRCRIIGRRFQLAHVYSGRDMIEVATFRAPPKDEEHTTSEGMITRDNVWGDIKQDFARRDFSINAMYYEPLKGVVHDFCDALSDIENKTLRLLGNAPVRIEEDPVRLLRALRFKAKLGFDFDKALSKQFHDDNWALLDQVSPHRLYDESQKMFTGGYLVPLLPLLFDYGAIKHLFVYPPKSPTALVNQVAINTDRRIAQGKSINPAFFYAALLWDNYLYQLDKFKKRNMPFVEAQQQAASKVIERQRIKTAIPKFAEQFIRDIWLMQPKLANPRVKQIAQLAEHPRFRAAFDFLLLREQCDDASNPLSESTNGMGEWWQTYQTLSEKQKQRAIDEFAGDSRRGASKRSRGRNRNRKAEIQDDGRNEHDEANEHLVTQQDEPKHQHDDDKHQPEYTSEQAQSRHQAKPPKQPQAVSASQQSAPSTASVQSAKTMSRPQRAHYAKERAQLQQLSLDNQLAGDAEQSANQPQPLFTISAQKLAKQVPSIEMDADVGADTDADRANNASVIPQQDVQSDSTQSNNTQSNKTAQGKTDSYKHANEPASSASKDNSASNTVALPKAQSIPAKRRRRVPSSEQSVNEQLANQQADSAQSEQAQSASKPMPKSTSKPKPAPKQAQGLDSIEAKAPNKVADKALGKVANNAQKNTDPIPRQRRRKAEPTPQEAQGSDAQSQVSKNIDTIDTKPKKASKTAPKKTATRKAKQATTAQSADTQVADSVASVSNVAKPSERVPAVRRRRQPSSMLSIAEREAIEQRIEQVVGA